MELRDLGFFEVIAEVGHLGRASERLGRTQPALTKCIQRLEARIGASLFVRTPRGLLLTPVGEALLGRAKRMRAAMEASLREVSELASGSAGHVRLGIGATLAEYLLPQVCRRLLRDSPGVTLDVLVAMSTPLRKALKQGDLDLVVGPIQDADEAEFVVTAIGEDEVVIVAARGHPLVGRPLDLADLVGCRWVLPARGIAMRDWLIQLFTSNHLPGPVVQIEANSIVMLPRLMAETDLLTFTSTRNLADGRLGANTVRLDVQGATMRRPLGIVARRGAYVSPVSSRLIGLFEDLGRKLIGPAGLIGRPTPTT